MCLLSAGVQALAFLNEFYEMMVRFFLVRPDEHDYAILIILLLVQQHIK
jgi:hypothetical protein